MTAGFIPLTSTEHLVLRSDLDKKFQMPMARVTITVLTVLYNTIFTTFTFCDDAITLKLRNGGEL